MIAKQSALTSEPQIQLETQWRNVSPLSSITKISANNSVPFINKSKLQRIKIKLRQTPTSASMSIGKPNRLILKTSIAYKLVSKKRLLRLSISH